MELNQSQVKKYADKQNAYVVLSGNSVKTRQKKKLLHKGKCENRGYNRKNPREKSSIVRSYCEKGGDTLKTKTRQLKVKVKVKRGRPKNLWKKKQWLRICSYEVC